MRDWCVFLIVELATPTCVGRRASTGAFRGHGTRERHGSALTRLTMVSVVAERRFAVLRHGGFGRGGMILVAALVSVAALLVSCDGDEEGATASPSAPAMATVSGIDEVDRAIAAVLAQDAPALASLVGYQAVACVSPSTDGLGGPPKCESGEAVGTVVEVFPVAYCEGTWARDALPVLEQFVASGPALYAVVRGPTAAEVEEYWPVGDVYIVFSGEVDGRTQGSRLEFKDGELVLAFFGCGHAPTDLMEYRGEPLEVLVPPAMGARHGEVDLLARR